MRGLIVVFLLVFANAAIAADRVALVIGIADYSSIPTLRNTVNDARDIAETLEGIGFDVTTEINASEQALRETLDDFAFRSETADLALIYFAGHGVEVQGRNFLIPRDAEVDSNRDIQEQSLSLDDLLAAVDRARKMRIVILDSCRDNPFGDSINLSEPISQPASDESEGSTRGGGGLAPPAPDRGTMVAFAAKDGNVALDGTGDNSPFALALMDKMKKPGLEISLMFRQVRDDVLRRTGNRQEPHTYGSLSGIPFFLAGRGDLPEGAVAEDPSQAWAAIRPDDEAQFRQLADEGDTRSLLGLAFMRLDPNAPDFNPAEAVTYLERAAEAGSAEAQYELAVQYERGKGVAQDEAKALELYRQSASQDYPDALNDLGFFHYHGLMGLPSDPDRALEFFERAADQRHPQAMYNFAALIDDGAIPGKTYEDAAEYLYRALRVGNPEVLKALVDHPDALEPETRMALQRKLREFAFYEGAIDGSFGPGTQRGLRKAYGLNE